MREHGHGRNEPDPAGDFDAACYQCGGAGTELTRDETGMQICRGCREDVQRQQQFIDWGFGEAPDDLG